MSSRAFSIDDFDESVGGGRIKVGCCVVMSASSRTEPSRLQTCELFEGCRTAGRRIGDHRPDRRKLPESRGSNGLICDDPSGV